MGRLRCLQSTGTALIFLLTVKPCLAQDAGFYETTPLPNRLIPEYTPCIYNGAKFACFTKEQVTELFMFELRAKYWHTQWRHYLLTIPKKEAQTDNLQLQIDTHTLLELAAKERTTVLNQQLKEAIEEKNEWRTKATNTSSWPLWVGSIVGLLGVGAFLGSLFQ
jgi:hypothetical protein